MLNKFDLHCHTFHSPDAWTSPRKMMHEAKKKGMAGLAITDHRNIRGWAEAISAAREFGVIFIAGEEAAVIREGRKVGEILGLFLMEKTKGQEPLEILDSIHAQGGIASIPHPFDRFRKHLREEELRELAHKIDAIETFNPRCIFSGDNRKAAALAQEFDLGKTSGSDAHTHWEIGRGYTVAEADDEEGLRKEILAKRTGGEGRKVHALRFTSTLGKLRTRLFGRRHFAKE